MKKEVSFAIIMTILFAVLVLLGVFVGCGGGGGDTSSGGGDTSAPTTPTNLNASAPSINQINLSWDIATDNVGVVGYKIYRDGAYLKSVTGAEITTSDMGLNTNTTYCYTVSSYDAANNESSKSTQSCATTLYTKQLGTSSIDTGNGVAMDASGNVYVVGSTRGSLDGESNLGDWDAFLVKYSATGIKQWTRLIGTSSIDNGRGVAVDENGNIYVTGVTYGGLDGNINTGHADMFLVKYNISGTKQWTRQQGTSSIDTGNGVAVDASGNIYVTGATNGSLDGNINAGDSDMFLVKYNTNGNKK